MLTMLTLYGIAIWLVFFKFRWLEMTKRAGCNVVFIGAVFLLVVYVGLGRLTPTSSDAVIQATVIQVGSRVEGRVEKVFVENEQLVKAGDPLYSVETLPYQLALDQAKASLLKAQQDGGKQYAAFASTRQRVARLESDLKLQRSELVRVRGLFAKRVASRQDLDRQQTKVVSLEEELGQARFDVRQAEVALWPADVLRRVLAEKKVEAASNPSDPRVADELRRVGIYVQEAEAAEALLDADLPGIMEARARLARAEYDLAETTVYAPRDGWVTNLVLAPGKNLLLARWEVISLVATDPWWINASFVERALERIRPGDRCELALKSYPGRIFKCRVSSVNRGVAEGQGAPSGDLPSVTPSQSPVQAFPVWIEVMDERLDGALRAGGKARVTVYTGEGVNYGLNALARILIRLGSLLDFFI